MNDGQKRVIESYYLRLYPLLIEYARSSIAEPPLAEEAVQETFRIACQKADAFLSSPNPEGWLVNTLKNVIGNILRHRDAARQLLQDYISANAEELLAQDPLAQPALLYGDLVNTEEYRLVKAIYLDGVSYPELSEELGINLSACRKRVQRAKEFLQKKLKL